MMLAEDLLLLAHTDDTSRRVGGNKLECAVAGALLIDLAEDGTVDVVGDDGSDLRLDVCDRTAAGHAVLDEFAAELARFDGGKPKDVIAGIGGALAERIVTELARRGIARTAAGRPTEFTSTSQWPEADSRHAFDLRTRLRDVLVEGATPDERTGALISLLAAIDITPRAIGEVDRTTVKQRVHTIAEGHWASGARRRAVEEITAVVMLATLAPAALTTS